MGNDYSQLTNKDKIMYCTSCGKQLTNGKTVCPYCGWSSSIEVLRLWMSFLSFLSILLGVVGAGLAGLFAILPARRSDLSSLRTIGIITLCMSMIGVVLGVATQRISSGNNKLAILGVVISFLAMIFSLFLICPS